MLPQPSGLSELSPQSAAKALECSQPSSVWPGLQDASIVTAGKVPFPSTPSPIWAWIKGEDEVPRFFLWSRRRTVQGGNFFLVYWFCI